jgi:hypothetical protein
VRRVLEEKNQMIASMREEIQGMKLSLGLGVTVDQHQVSREQYHVRRRVPGLYRPTSVQNSSE